ncbi:hypothetical protein ABZ690_17505 [Streptomyces sp. NPDC006967]|uniref:hypothetical protein n=1 Tax=unclassified Streptomyces TaxID=2593676 RepID=UPI0021561697|nr:hypothetical protein [Streptomyces sp. SM1]
MADVRLIHASASVLAWPGSMASTRVYAALHFSSESGEVAGEDYGQAELLVLEAIRRSAESAGLPDGLAPCASRPDAVPGSRLTRGLAEWVRSCPRPLVLFFDEIDALRGKSLRSVLRQLRDGFTVSRGVRPTSSVTTSHPHCQ